MRTKKMATILQNEVVTRLPSKMRGSIKGEMLTAAQIKKVPKNIVFGTLTVLENPEPIRKRRASSKRHG